MRNSAILAAFLLLTFSNAQAENSYDSNVDAVYIHSQKTTLFTPGFHELPIGPVAYQRYNWVFADQCGCNRAFSGSGGRKLAMTLSLR